MLRGSVGGMDSSGCVEAVCCWYEPMGAPAGAEGQLPKRSSNEAGRPWPLMPFSVANGTAGAPLFNTFDLRSIRRKTRISLAASGGAALSCGATNDRDS